MSAPCKNCENRHPYCHSTCEAYQAYDRENKERNNKRVLEHSSIHASHDRREKAYFKSLKKRGG